MLAGFILKRYKEGMIPLETTPCGMYMFYRVKRVADGTLDLHTIYGNTLIGIMKTGEDIRNNGDHTNLFIMKRVSTKMMQKRENCILNPGWASAISNKD